MIARSLSLFLLLAAFASVAPAHAQRLLNENFEEGLSDSWRGNPGKGSIRLTEYASNHSVRLTRNAWAARIVSLPEGTQTVRLSALFAADDLEADDACLLETSLDGKDWTEHGRIGHAQADSLTLHPISAEVSVAGKGWFALRLRIDGNASNDTCWADNVAVDVVRDPSTFPSAFPETGVPSGYVASSAFAPPLNASPPMAFISFRLRMEKEQPASDSILLKDERGYANLPELFTLPAFDASFVSDGGDLVPIPRGAISGTHPEWEWMFSPGRIWQANEGSYRASLPVALREVNANCLHTGHLTFTLTAEGAVSDAYVQFTAETCAYLQFDLRAAGLPLSAEMEAVDHPESVRAAWRRETSARLPVRPVSQIGQDYPTIAPGALGSPDEISPVNMSVYGLLVDGTLYRGGCETRTGEDPYCGALPLPSYSLAKSIVAGIVLMRMEMLYPGTADALIADYVPECSRDRWGDVTFANALDMATGLYTSTAFEADEGAASLWDFMRQTTHSGRIERACAIHPKQAPPGEVWVYHTTDTYVLGTALQAYWREKSGRPDADFYDDLLVPLWRELGLSPLLDTTGRSYDAARQPQAGWGLALYLDDIMRIARFLQDGGKIDGAPWLAPTLLAQALQRAPTSHDLLAGDPTTRYKAGFWAWNAGSALGCKRDVWIPAMSGYGGITIALMPNGHVYSYFSDGQQFAWRRAAEASNSISPFCEVTR